MKTFDIILSKGIAEEIEFKLSDCVLSTEDRDEDWKISKQILAKLGIIKSRKKYKFTIDELSLIRCEIYSTTEIMSGNFGEYSREDDPQFYNEYYAFSRLVNKIDKILKLQGYTNNDMWRINHTY
jgi:hypothetical protein